MFQGVPITPPTGPLTPLVDLITPPIEIIKPILPTVPQSLDYQEAEDEDNGYCAETNEKKKEMPIKIKTKHSTMSTPRLTRTEPFRITRNKQIGGVPYYAGELYSFPHHHPSQNPYLETRYQSSHQRREAAQQYQSGSIRPEQPSHNRNPSRDNYHNNNNTHQNNHLNRTTQYKPSRSISRPPLEDDDVPSSQPIIRNSKRPNHGINNNVAVLKDSSQQNVQLGGIKYGISRFQPTSNSTRALRSVMKLPSIKEETDMGKPAFKRTFSEMSEPEVDVDGNSTIIYRLPPALSEKPPSRIDGKGMRRVDKIITKRNGSPDIQLLGTAFTAYKKNKPKQQFLYCEFCEFPAQNPKGHMAEHELYFAALKEEEERNSAIKEASPSQPNNDANDANDAKDATTSNDTSEGNDATPKNNTTSTSTTDLYPLHPRFYCHPCHNVFYSELAYRTHCRSKRHRDITGENTAKKSKSSADARLYIKQVLLDTDIGYVQFFHGDDDMEPDGDDDKDDDAIDYDDDDDAKDNDSS